MTGTAASRGNGFGNGSSEFLNDQPKWTRSRTEVLFLWSAKGHLSVKILAIQAILILIPAIEEAFLKPRSQNLYHVISKGEMVETFILDGINLCYIWFPKSTQYQ